MSKTFIILFLVYTLGLSVSAQVTQAPLTLVPGQSVEREIAGGESHAYQISLTAGQFVRVVVEQKAVDVALVLSAPDGKQLGEINLTAVGGLESLSAEAAASGNYRLTVRAAAAATRAGSYQVRLEVKVAATSQDRQRIAAERWMIEADELRKQEAKTAEQAIDKLQQALAVWRELGDPYWAAWSLSSIGAAYHSLSRYEKAIEYYQLALPILRELKNRRGEGIALNSLGNALVYLNRYDQATEYLEQALAIAREVKNRAGEGSALISLGNVYYVQSRYEKAIEYYEQTLAIFRELKNRAYEGSVLNNLGLAYSNLNRYEKAIEYLEQALVLAREAKDRGGEGWTLNNLGSAYSSLSRYEKAIEYHEQALAILREVKDRWGEGGTLNFLGLDYYNLSRYEKAIEYYEQALAVNREVQNRFGEGIVLNGLGQAYEKTRRYEKAVEYYAQALAINREVKNRISEADTLYTWARTETAQGNISAARTHVEESLKINESTRAEVISPESRASFLASVQSSYQLYTNVLMRQHQAQPTKGFDALAIEVSERQRARSLLDLLSEAHADMRQGVDSALIEREGSLAKQLNDKAQTQTNTPEQADALKREISQLETDLERAQAAIRKANPHYAALVQPQPLKLKEIQAQLDADTLLLEYSLGEDRSYLWAITKDSLTSYELPKEELIEKNARQVYELLTARSISKRGETAPQRQERISQAEANLPAAARGLSQTILAPVVAELGNKRLVIVADGALQYIPFAMLPEPEFRVSSSEFRAQNPKRQTPNSKLETNSKLGTRNSKPLIVNHEVVSLPSASALAIQRKELAGRQLAPKLLAVIADPVFDRSDARLTGIVPVPGGKMQIQNVAGDDARSIEHLATNSGDQAGATNVRLVIPRLPFTRQEADQLLELTPKTSSFRATDFLASRTTVLDPSLGQYRYLHFATHGFLDSERPGLSALVFSMVDAQGKAQDGFLRANDIYNLKLPAELVVLSACQTGLGKEIRGEGLVGLTRGFMYAGAARVVVSLWNVNDKATADLMTKFYEKMLKQGERPAAALRAAQVEMWRQKQWQSPYYWAAFSMQGEWR